MQLTLRYVRIFALDWERTVSFYEQVLCLPQRYRNDDVGWVEFDVGGPCLAIERIRPEDAEEEPLTGRFLGISLHVDDINEAYQKLNDQGVKFIAPPEKQPWGGFLAHFEDPEANVLTLLGR
jgi:predicted enzyme related to lactoylglutathione lyase